MQRKKWVFVRRSGCINTMTEPLGFSCRHSVAAFHAPLATASPRPAKQLHGDPPFTTCQTSASESCAVRAHSPEPTAHMSQIGLLLLLLLCPALLIIPGCLPDAQPP